MDLTLAQALRVQDFSCVAFIGAGGKTTAMFQLARQLSKPVIVTATTHLGVWQTKLADQHIIPETPARTEVLEHGLNGVTLITGAIDGDRTKPISEDLLGWLHPFCRNLSIPLLIEADGSRGKPVKAWAGHEPPVPAFVEMVIQVVGLKGLGKPLRDKYVHRAELFSQLSGHDHDALLTPEILAKALIHQEGGLKNIPRAARRVALLNQADTHDLQSAAHKLAQLLSSHYPTVVIASLQQERVYAVHEPIAGVILAAGKSTRFGEPKQLLHWKGQPFVRAVAIAALEAGLSPVVAVTGANAEQVEAALEELDVQIIRNAAWEQGQGSSIRAGVGSLVSAGSSAGYVGGAIFLLADQPQITTSVLRALVERHAQGLYSVVAPMVMDQRANPVLFDRATFDDLMNLEGDVGGRAIFHKHRVEYLPWHDDRLLLDVDTPEMYQRLISDETL